MGGITGATSGKFVLMAATLLFHGRVDNARMTIAIVPGAPHSAIGATLANRIAHRDRVKIGIRAFSVLSDLRNGEPRNEPGMTGDVRAIPDPVPLGRVSKVAIRSVQAANRSASIE